MLSRSIGPMPMMPWLRSAGLPAQSTLLKKPDWLVMPPKSIDNAGSSPPTWTVSVQTSPLQEPLPYCDEAVPEQCPLEPGVYSGETPQLVPQAVIATPMSVEPVSTLS